MKVRNIIEVLAKCDWDSEVTCIHEETFEMSSVNEEAAELGPHDIMKISQSTKSGTQIVFSAL